MAKDQAKIKFIAETKEFTAGLKNANSALASLRAGLKLNESEFKNTGDKAEYLNNKHKLLKAELEANRQKQEALNGKVEAAKRIYGENSTQVNEWTTKLTRAKTEEQNLQKALDQCEAEMEQQRQEAEKLQTPLEKLTKEIEEQQTELERLKTDYKNVALEQGTGSDAAQELKAEIDQLNGELDENEKKLREVEDAMEDAGQEAEQSANGGWTVAKGIFADLASKGIQLAIDKLKEFAKQTVELGMNFTSSMSRVQALSGATDEQLADLEKTARSLGASTIFSASEVADAFSYMALAGWDTEDMINGVDGVLNLAAAAEMDLAEASDIVTDYLTAFGLSAEDSAGFVDQLTYAMANSNTDVSMLGEAYKNCASTANSMGYSVEDVTAVLMTMANAGVKGGEAGTGLSTIMTRLATDTSKCASVLSEYGVEVYDAEGNMNSLSSILNGCSEIWGDLTDQEQANLAKTIAGTSQYSKFQTVMSGLSDSAAESGMSFNDYAEALENCGGSAAEMSDVMQDNLGGDLAELKSAFEEFQLSIFEDFEEPLREGVSFVTENVIPVLGDFWDWICMAAGEIREDFQPVVGLLQDALKDLKKAFQPVVEALQPLIEKFKEAHGGVSFLKGTLLPIKAAIAAVAVTFKALAVTVKIVVSVVKGIITVVQAVIEKFREFKEKIQEVWTRVKEVLQNIADKFTEIWTGIKDFFQTVWDTITGILEIAIGAIVTVLEGAFNLITLPWQAIWAWFGDYILAAWETIKNVISTAVNAVKTVITTVFNAIKTVFTTYVNAWKAIITTVWNAIKKVVTTAVNAVKTVISTVFNTVKNTATTVWNKIKTAITTPITAAKNTITTVVNNIKTTITNVFNAVRTTASNIFNGIKNAMTTPITAAKNTIKGIIDTIKGFFTKLKLKIPKPELPKLPHFKLKTGTKMILGKEITYPTGFGVEWYAKGAVFDSPTIIPTLSGLKGVGEAGPEAVAPIDVLRSYVQEAVEMSIGNQINTLASSIEALAKRPNYIQVNGRTIMTALAGDADNALGTRQALTGRGLSL